MRRSGWLVLVLTGCGEPAGPKGETGGADADDAAVSLALTLSAATAVAGEDVGYTLQVTYESGAVEAVEGDVSSDLEGTLATDTTTLTPTVAGAHTITGAAEGLTATATLDVAAGPLAELSLVLDPAEIAPTELSTGTVTGADAFGNEVDASAATLSAQDLTVDGATVTGTAAGTWTVTATLDDVSGDASLVVVPGAAAALDLSVDPTEGLDPGDDATATVAIVDAWGNATADAWTLTVDGGDATVVGDEITFDGEGVFTVTAASGALADSVGPIYVDASGPTLVVTTPARGSWAGGSVDVAGTATDDVSGVASVTVGGAAATLDASGAFFLEVATDFGLNVLETVATDGDGNTAGDTRAALSGSVLPYGDAEEDGLVVRLHEGAGGLDALTDGMGALVDTADVLDALPSPLYSDETSSCYTLFGRTYCVDYSLEFTVSSVTWASADVSLDPQADGTVLVTLTLTDPEADWTASGEVSGAAYSETGAATADSLVVTAELTLVVEDGEIVAYVGDVESTLTNLDLDLPSEAATVLSVIGYDLEADVEDQLNAAVMEMFTENLPDAISDGLGELSFTEALSVGDATATLTATPSAIDVDDAGITLSLGTVVTVDTWSLAYTSDGSLEYGYAQPTWTGTPGALLGLSADFLDQLFLAAWGGGALSMEMTDEDIGVDMTIIGLLLPGLSDLYVVVEPLLPPVAVPTPSGASPFDLQTGELLVRFYDGESASTPTYEVYVSMIAPMDVALSGDALTTTIGTPTVWADVVTAPADTDEASLESALELLAPSLLSSGTSALGDVPLPTLAGYTLTSTTVSTGGAESGYVVVAGDLTGS